MGSIRHRNYDMQNEIKMFDKIKVDETSCVKMQMEVIVVSGLILETKGFT
jgi:hypothetical protein